MLFVSCCQLVGVHQCGGEGQTLLLRLLVHRAALLGFPPHRVGLMLTARGAHIYSHGAVERSRRLMYLFLIREQVPSHRFSIFSWHRYQCSKPPIPRTHPVQRCLLWLVVIITASVLMAGVPTVMSACHPLMKRGWMSPPVGHHRCLGGFPTHALLIWVCLFCCDVESHPSSGSGLPQKW
jgi:hypothetical protein